jgi:hypothetical protein
MLPQRMNSIPCGRVGYTQHHATCVRLTGRQPTCARLFAAVSRFYGAEAVQAGQLSLKSIDHETVKSKTPDTHVMSHILWPRIAIYMARHVLLPWSIRSMLNNSNTTKPLLLQCMHQSKKPARAGFLKVNQMTELVARARFELATFGL